MFEGHYAYRFLLILLMLGLNAFFASAEVALISIRRGRLSQLAQNGNVGAQTAIVLLQNQERLLSVVQVGVTLASLGLGWAGAGTVFQLVSPLFQPLIAPSAAAILYGLSFAASFAILTFAHVVIGELVPKNLGIEKGDKLAVLVAPALLVFYRVAEPFVYIIEGSARAIGRIMGLKGDQHGGGHSAEELKLILSSSQLEGHLRPFEVDAINRVLDLEDYSAREIMVPRHSMVAVSVDASLDQVLRSFLDHQYSRLPVYKKNPENIIGMVHYKDLIRVWEERRAVIDRGRPAGIFSLRRVLRPALVVPETKPLNELVDEFRKNRTHMAMVVDEFGTISGLVTLEDVLEQVFGEIEDEHDEQRLKPPGEDNVLELEGTVNIRDLETQYGIALPGDAGFETLAGFLLFQFGAIPKMGDIVDYDGRRFTILAMQRNRIASVRIEKVA
ncbi:MAG: hemolysin family protein [Bryobacteraceae bacterium]